MIAVGTALVARVAIELEGLVDGVGSRGCGDVDELLDVPPCRLGPVGLRVEAPVHARGAPALVPAGRERYGYQSVRAGSHRWTCASTTRAGLRVIGPPGGSPGREHRRSRGARRPSTPGSRARRRRRCRSAAGGPAARSTRCPTTSSAPARAAGLGVAEEVRDELAGLFGRVRPGRLDARRQRGDPPSRPAGCGTCELCRGLGPAPARRASWRRSA